jgi:hypothetical protein
MEKAHDIARGKLRGRAVFRSMGVSPMSGTEGLGETPMLKTPRFPSYGEH